MSDDQTSTILADDLDKDQVASLVQFMTGMANREFMQHGRRIVAVGVLRKKIKFLLHKFLHVQKLADYGVLDTSGTFQIIHVRPEEKPSESMRI